MHCSLGNNLGNNSTLIDKMWFGRHPLAWLLLPLSIVFWVIVQCRKGLFKLGIKTSRHPNVPVLMVGNITVGGNGKTPVVLKAVEWLIELGYSPGILSRGYGGTCQAFPYQVGDNDTASFVGDEPMLMALRRQCPVIIDPMRTRGADSLVALGCNIIVCDDGLQHYALERDIEWVVMDDRAIGNGWFLPAGPLREAANKLNHVDAVLHNGANKWFANASSMSLMPKRFVNLLEPSKTLSVEGFVEQYKDQKFEALAGIGSPQRFFNTLQTLGLNHFDTKSFVDHHPFSAADIPPGPTVMTEKDAVKCAAFAHQNCWYLEVDATLPNQLKEQLSERLRRLANAD
jgi:tetraacyldisaccharide 4'-kinase